MTFLPPARYDPTGGEIWEGMRAYQSNLQGMDRRALGGLARTYREIQPDFRAAVEGIQAQAARAAGVGRAPSAAWAFQTARYQQLDAQVQAMVARLTIVTGTYADEAGMAALTAQNKFFERLAQGQASYGAAGDIRGWATLPSRTVESFMGLSQASPLMRKFEAEAGRDAMRAVRTTLAGGIATGRPARVTARLMQQRVAGVTLTRAMTITRTESARARRAAALASFQQNPVVRGWVWRAALDRSCPACIALHGKEFPTDEMQQGHPNCRCVMVPMRHRGVNPDVGTGGSWLATKTPEEWRSILGPGRAEWLSRASTEELRKGGTSIIGALDRALARQVTLQPHRGYGGMYRPTTLGQLRGRPTAPALPPASPRGAPVRPNIEQSFRNQARTRWEREYGRLPADAPIPRRQLEIREHVRAELARGELSMRRTPRSSLSILREGRFKSQFETGRSGGSLSPSSRGAAEHRMFGYPAPKGAIRDPNTGMTVKPADTHAEWNAVFPGEKRPVYGYIKDPATDVDGAEWYGDVRFVMKNEVRARSTFTNGDSLGEAFSPFHFDDDNLEWVTTSGYGSALGDKWKLGTNGYTEVQYHGGLHMSDVAEVVLPRRSRIVHLHYGGPNGSVEVMEQEFKDLVDELERQRIPWRFEAERTGF